jgi:hypothetical protein
MIYIRKERIICYLRRQSGTKRDGERGVVPKPTPLHFPQRFPQAGEVPGTTRPHAVFAPDFAYN